MRFCTFLFDLGPSRDKNGVWAWDSTVLYLLTICDPTKVCTLVRVFSDEWDELFCSFSCDCFTDDDTEMVNCETPWRGGQFY